jgi:hypothetical protein
MSAYTYHQPPKPKAWMHHVWHLPITKSPSPKTKSQCATYPFFTHHKSPSLKTQISEMSKHANTRCLKLDTVHLLKHWVPSAETRNSRVKSWKPNVTKLYITWICIFPYTFHQVPSTKTQSPVEYIPTRCVKTMLNGWSGGAWLQLVRRALYPSTCP